MPWHIESDNSACKGFAVVKNDTGKVVGCHPSKAKAQAHLAALYANEPSARDSEDNMTDVETTHPEREIRLADVGEWEIRHSGRKDEAFTVRGYAAVYDQMSHDLGGFREKLAPGAFDKILTTDPDVHFVWDHDTRYVGARTRNGTLSLRSDEQGLFIDAQVGNYTWAKDLRTALDRGDISQGSFAFTVDSDGEEWNVEEDESVMRTIRSVSGLYDVTVTAQGAYPQTSLAAVRSMLAAKGRPVSPEAMLVAEAVEAEKAAADRGESESQKGSVEATEAFVMWKEAMQNKAAARRITLAKLAEKLEKLE